jgi:hypothetical protein
VVALYTTRFNIKKTLRSAHIVHLCVLYGSEIGQRLFLLLVFIMRTGKVYCAVRTQDLNINEMRLHGKDCNANRHSNSFLGGWGAGGRRSTF